MANVFTDIFQQKGGNRAIAVNPPSGVDFHITKRGSDWLWAVFACFGFLMVIYIVLFFVAELKGSRITRYAIAPAFLITLFEFFGYFTYASNLGWAGVQAEFNHVTVDTSITGLTPGVRQIFYAKFIAWVLSWPCLLFLIELAAVGTTLNAGEKVSALDLIHSLLVQMTGTLYWVVALLVGSLIHSTYKWGYFTFGAVTMLVVQGLMVRRQFFALKTRGFTACLLILSMLIVWAYFICWGVSEGGNKIQPDSEAIFYGILDLCIFGILPAYLVFITNHYGIWPDFGMSKKNDMDMDTMSKNGDMASDMASEV
ncbi:Glutathione-independent glyoxalase HSP31 [Nakaseomyces bracarensis]|uniref:Glutathione-independent glyoxalase HSP31 n=1 Tax=Nakaseomyces bracarensis TaxID=273131 RepID=A0ABR4NX24_9SACH